MTAERSAADYLLPEAENRRIFNQEIVPEKMWGVRSRSRPVVVFLVGQPGAGKSRVGAMVGGILKARGGFVDVDSDLYKPYHPAYQRLMAEDDKLMAAFTRADGRKWMARAHEYVRSHKLNAVIQETSQDARAVMDTMRAYRSAGFQVEVLAMGVPKAMSDQGIVARYHEQVQDRGRGRLTVQKNADESYRGILELGTLIDEERPADRVGVYRRGENDPRYANSLGADGDWTRPPGLRTAIETERSRPWTETEATDFLRTQGTLRRELGPEWSGNLRRIEQLARPLMDDTAAYAHWLFMQKMGVRDPMQLSITPHSSSGLASPAPAQRPSAGPNVPER